MEISDWIVALLYLFWMPILAMTFLTIYLLLFAGG